MPSFCFSRLGMEEKLRLLKSARQDQLDFCERFFSLFSLAVGGWLLFVPHSMNHPGYFLLTATIPQIFWAIALLVTGTMRQILIRDYRAVKAKSLIAFLEASIWGWFAVSIYLRNGPSMGVSVYSVLSIQNVRLYLFRVQK